MHVQLQPFVLSMRSNQLSSTVDRDAPHMCSHVQWDFDMMQLKCYTCSYLTPQPFQHRVESFDA